MDIEALSTEVGCRVVIQANPYKCSYDLRENLLIADPWLLTLQDTTQLFVLYSTLFSRQCGNDRSKADTMAIEKLKEKQVGIQFYTDVARVLSLPDIRRICR